MCFQKKIVCYKVSYIFFVLCNPQESSEEEANAENQQDVVPQVLENLVEGDNEDNVDSDSGGIQGGGGGGSDNMISDDDSQEYKKTLRLTSDEWKKLNLKFGKNKVTFTVTTRYQVSFGH